MRRNARRRISDIHAVTTANEAADSRMIRLHVDYVRRTGATERTRYHRHENLRRLMRQLPCPLLEATPDILEDWQASLRVSLSSVATYTSHARAFYLWAVDAGHIDHNPALRLPRPRVPAGRPRPIPRADLELALQCAPEPLYTWIVLGSFMGLRAAEVAGIRREDVAEGIIDGRKRMFLSGMGKGAKPYRLPVPVEVVPILQKHLSGTPGPLWNTGTGAPVGAEYVSRVVAKFFRGIGLPYTMHACRHTYGTEVQQQTGDMLTTQVLMRHESLNTTRIYVEPVPTAGLEAMDRLSVRLSPRVRRTGAA